MDGLLNDGNRHAAAPVLRQFSPNRIERQLLAHIFALVCTPPADRNEPAESQDLDDEIMHITFVNRRISSMPIERAAA